jgi:hypothetical protein
VKPGRELDALVAEKVMGLNPKLFNVLASYYEVATEGPRLPAYSTDIAAAWLVVEKMHQHPKWVLQLAAPQQDYVNEKWRAIFARKHWETIGPYGWDAFGESAPHAICLAALKAVGST